MQKPNVILDQSSILNEADKKLAIDIEEREQVRDQLKYGYSKDVMSLNLLLDKTMD